MKRFRRKDTLEDMSPDMQTLLIHCNSRGVHPKEFDEPSRWSTVTRGALEQHGLIELGKNTKGKDLWLATEEGRRVVSTEVPRFLAARPGKVQYKTLPNGRQAIDESDMSSGDYTHRSLLAMRNEPEAA
jgi:hypothetical protein